VLRSDDIRKDPRFNADACGRVSAASLICAPLVHGEKTIGVLSVYSPDPDHFDDRDAEALELLGGLTAAHMSHATVFGIESYDNRHDALTALPNLRAFEERLSVEVARTGRYERPLSLCLLDIDHFKRVNDRLGHPAGDEVLRSVARILDQSRLTDDCFRIGGDEFAIVMPDTTAKEARVATARIAEQLRVACPGDGQLEVSFGVAGITDADPANLLAAAEGQLLAAKDRLYGSDREG
jgi:diguanylate cyclase (GGDEF)-like protein